MGAAAGAAQAKGFDLWTGTAATAGKAHGYGKVTFLSKTRAKIAGHINDICPSDGYGRTVRQDTATCGGAAKSFSFKTPKTTRKIKNVGVTVIELDNQNGVLTPGDAARKLLDNPRV